MRRGSRRFSLPPTRKRNSWQLVKSQPRGFAVGKLTGGLISAFNLPQGVSRFGCSVTLRHASNNRGTSQAGGKVDPSPPLQVNATTFQPTSHHLPDCNLAQTPAPSCSSLNPSAFLSEMPMSLPPRCCTLGRCHALVFYVSLESLGSHCIPSLPQGRSD